MSASRSLWLRSGESCLFVRKPKVLVEELKKVALNLGVFCEGDTYPIAECKIPFSGCLCDQVAMAQNDPDHAPKPYSLKGGFHLVDPGENPSGTIDLDIRLVCLGKSISTQYQLDSTSFLFKNDKDESEFCVKPVITTGVPGDVVELEEMKCPDSILPESFDEEKRPQRTSK
ncbi:uncharacterized protein LOC107264887 isoform X2 [Cephus cinctus]|uniref:Uncharacterized protein LOC107264887 isoform X2 n=1 Tax=Cephus cinctus TaxID=211228 RepID=A0AAJ7RC83_CEPCN|nr:uncharacterized protein LOC107264887 isoform X2 [Cephus cinctus]